MSTRFIESSGGEDIRPSWPAEQLANFIPNATFELLANAPHVIWATHPDELRSRLRQFLMALSE